jgi:tol-pal system protein YbgF
MQRRIQTVTIVAFGTAMLHLAPVSAADRETRQIMADVRMLQEQTQQLQLLLNTLTDALKAVTTKIDDQSGVTRKAFADHRLLVETLTGDIRVVREKVDDANVRLGSLTQEVDALRLAVNQIPVTPASMAPTLLDPAAPLDPAATPTPPPAPVPVTPVAGQSPQRLYDSAWSDYTAGSWTLAIKGFETYLQLYPRSPLAPDAQNYIGLAAYNDESYRDAVTAFDKVIADYPTSDRVAEAFYYRGRALEGLKEPERARESYEGAIKRDPNSQAATLAKQQLDRLNRSRR